jgi:hypothetical protein
LQIYLSLLEHLVKVRDIDFVLHHNLLGLQGKGLDDGSDLWAKEWQESFVADSQSAWQACHV